MIRELSGLINEHMNYPLFGILLFTESDPHIIKVLKDADYYAALDEITGNSVALFATILFQGEYKYPLPPPGEIANMMPIWKEPRENKKILPWFNIRDSRELPLLVIFGHQNRDFYYKKYRIKADTPEAIFNDLKDVLSRMSATLQKLGDEGVISKQVMFKQAQWEIRKLEVRQTIKDFFETISTFRGVIGV